MSILSVALAIPLVLAPLSAEPDALTLDTVLTRWCQASQSTSRFDAEFHFINYDSTFNVERWQAGRFYFCAPRKGRVEFRQAKLPDAGGGRSRKVVQGGSTTWIWPGDRLVIVDEASRTYRVFGVPNEAADPNAVNTVSLASFNTADSSVNSPQSLLPLVVDVNEANLRREFRFELMPSDTTEVRLSATPQTKAWTARYQSIQVILDREGFHVKAIRYIAPGGVSQSVVVFSAVKINQVPGNEESLLHPDLEKLRYRNSDPPK